MNKPILVIITLCAVMITACSKHEQEIAEAYNIPTYKKISNIDNVSNKVVEVEIVLGGVKSKFISTISFPHPMLGTEEVNVLDINGYIDGAFVHNDDADQPMVSIIMNKKTNEIFSVKVIYPRVGQTWNASSLAPVGVVEDYSKTVITSNLLYSPTQSSKYLCIKITIRKQN